MTEKKSLEQEILVFPTSLLHEIGYFQGITPDYDKYLSIIEEKVTYKKRNLVEEDPSYKQIIPYLVVCCNRKVLRYKRGALLSEKRLSGNYSIGVGGHVERRDQNMFTSIIDEAAQRELMEEVRINTAMKIKKIAVLNDDSNPVGKVHFGVILLVTLAEMKVEKNEKSINEIEFIELEELKENMEKYESWSRICIEHIEEIIE